MAVQILIIHYPFLTFFALELCVFIIILHCCGQVRVLSNTIQRIDGRILHDNPARRYQCSCIKCIVETHWKIIRFHKAIQRFIAPIACLNILFAIVFANTFIILICTPTSSDSVLFETICCIYFAADMVGTFLYCHGAEMLTQESLNLRDVVFNSKWYNLPQKDAKSCLIIMTYCQNVPMQFKFGLFYTGSLALFKNVVMVIYSFYNLARSMRDNR